MSEPFTHEERWLIEQLRSEARDVKQCFTTFCFQALALSATVLGLTLAAMKDGATYAAYVTLPLVPLLMSVARLGIHKFSTANRNHGFELHLARAKNIEYLASTDRDPLYDSAKMAFMPWEEALRAWRIVQPTIFRRIYVTPQTDRIASRLESVPGLRHLNSLLPWLYRLSDAAERSKDAYPWFLPGLLAEKQHDPAASHAAYYTGNYLSDMIFSLFLMQYAALAPLAIRIATAPERSAYIVADCVALAVMILIIGLRQRRIGRRRIILEQELLSIHSCAIVWQAVSLIHALALEELRGREYKHYTAKVARIASELSQQVFEIHDWLGRSRVHA